MELLHVLILFFGGVATLVAIARSSNAAVYRRALRQPIPLILSDLPEDDGVASLAMALAYLGKRVPLDRLRETVLDETRAATGLSIVKTAQRYGVAAKGFRWTREDLDSLPKGSILHWDGSRFVVFERLSKDGAEIIHPHLGRELYPRAEFEQHFLVTGIALLFGPNAY